MLTLLLLLWTPESHRLIFSSRLCQFIVSTRNERLDVKRRNNERCLTRTPTVVVSIMQVSQTRPTLLTATVVTRRLFRRWTSYLRDRDVIKVLRIGPRSAHGASSLALFSSHSALLSSIPWIWRTHRVVPVAVCRQFVCHMRRRRGYKGLSPGISWGLVGKLLNLSSAPLLVYD